MDSPIRLLIVDDQDLIRGALADRLNKEPDIEVVAQASDAEQAIDIAAKEKVDVILMDADMPGLSSFEATRTIHAVAPKTRVILLSDDVQDWFLEQAITVKAAGFVTKHNPPERVAELIREAAAGRPAFCDAARQRVVIDSGGGVMLATPGERPIGALTARELDVLRYIARGLSKKQIASTMHLSIKTVDRHSTNLMSKLGIHDRVKLARFAIREGLAEA